MMTETAEPKLYDWAVDAGYAYNELPQTRTEVVAQRLRRLGIITLMTAVGVAGFGEVYAHDPAYAVKYAEAVLTEHDCGTTPLRDQQLVQAELAQPNPKAEQLPPVVSSGTDAEAYRRYAAEQAAANGLTLIDDEPFQNELAAAKSPAAVVRVLSSFGREYGFGVELLDTRLKMLLRPVSEQENSDDQPVNTRKIDMDAFRRGASAFMQTLHFIPAEVIRRSKLETIRLAGTLSSDWSGEVSGEAYINTNVIAFTVSDFSSADPVLYAHEIGHRIDFAMCGMVGSWKDAEYTDLNPPGFHYTKDSAKPATATASQYGRSDVYEDIATMYEYMLTRLNPDLFDNPSKAISRKYRLLLARLEDFVPGYSQYLSAISSRTPEPNAADSMYG